MPKFAANLTMMFNEQDFPLRFKAAADAGFKAVEFLFPYDFEAEKLAALLGENGLEQALFNLPPGDWNAGERGLAALPERHAEFRDSVLKALRYAAALKAPCLHVMSGIADKSDARALAAYQQALEYACAKAAPHGIDILIEPINARDMPGYFLNDFNFAARLIADMALPNLKLQYDIYHRQIIHGDVMVSLEKLMPIIGHIQVAAVPQRHEPLTGELDDARIFRHLDALGYQGFVGCEYRPANGTVNGLDWLRPYQQK
ncbi:MAG: hydroxypyruvate isomerase family protein [Hyphomicrobiales bacterium]|nr:hydroxypyruvate isomerase family protein [Hyphomicrobiales bacterium]MDE2114492.1 hydroxypyruvate isomerase family protein [Hyphomicrobiales bacterium]